ncbi:electron transport complex subunit RsxC [Pantoea sp. 1.19]|uniref:electron transport complex subunit RsxC n=1 Tax=Pantoea sp. 1.19 TaxID=1925589 RepID=UPI000948F063|nr:electron transport complex subunit RsxC [Pantoea sp. 1.19]
MRNLLNFFKKEPLWDFAGGIHPPENKTQSNGTPLRQLPLPARFIIPLKQHIGHEGELRVKPGDRVRRGDALTRGTGRMLPVHAPTSGTVYAIAPHMTAHPSGLAEIAIFLTPDGEDRWGDRQPIADYRAVDRRELVDKIFAAGVAGLGGAGFPTATKLRGGLRGVNTLIINAAECEPYITADDRLMQDHAAEVLEGSRILGWILQAGQILIGIEDNKPAAIAALRRALGSAGDITLRVIPTKYPSGGAKQLTKILTGKEVPHGGRSADIGVLMHNVGTAWAVKRAILDGEALTERVVTLTGEAVSQPGNVWGRIGTPVSHLLNHAGFTPGARQMVIMGGPLMGFTLPNLDVPVVKITNCLLAPSAAEMGEETPEKGCIRCSACADACPAGLLPQQLYWYSQGGDHDKARAHHIDDCIECGACAWVCPSNIPLVQYYRQEKAEIRAIDLEAARTAEAKARFEARQQRLEREKQARDAKHQQAKRSVTAQEQDAVQAALARVKAKRAAAGESVSVTAGAEPDNTAVIAQRAARKAEARARQAERQADTAPLAQQAADPRKAAVEAAIARAKAKRAATAADDAPAADADAAPADPRKAAVEAAIARAKAKRAATAADDAPAANADAAPADPRKAAVEAAIARAKAKRAATAADDAPAANADAAPADPRKAAVEAAIARAKAKRAATAADDAPGADADAVAAPADPRKAAVEAAIARAKAKRAATATDDAPGADADAVAAPADPRKAAVEAAIARAKAKRAATAADDAPAADAAPADPRKAAVEAAIARAKAKRAATAADDAPAADADAVAAPADPRKAAVEAAIARAKAKRAATAADAAPADPRKAAIEAAIARAQARKAQHAESQED